MKFDTLLFTTIQIDYMPIKAESALAAASPAEIQQNQQ